MAAVLKSGTMDNAWAQLSAELWKDRRAFSDHCFLRRTASDQCGSAHSGAWTAHNTVHIGDTATSGCVPNELAIAQMKQAGIVRVQRFVFRAPRCDVSAFWGRQEVFCSL
jgi:hypothetical protein